MAAIMDKTKDPKEEVMAKKIPQPNDQAAKKRVSSYIDGKDRPSQRPRPSTGMVSKVQICPDQESQEREAEKAISTLKSR